VSPNCPNCATNTCPNAADTRLHGYAVALMGLMDAIEHDGANLEEVMFLARVWREQAAIRREQNPKLTVPPLAADTAGCVVGTEIQGGQK